VICVEIHKTKRENKRVLNWFIRELERFDVFEIPGQTTLTLGRKPRRIIAQRPIKISLRMEVHNE